MKVTPRFKRWLCFSVPVRKKLASGLYLGNDTRGSFNRAEEIWVAERGAECTMDLSMGSHCYIHDAFELVDCGLDLWEHYKDRPEFSKLRAFVDACEGVVKTRLVTEHSILLEDPDYQCEGFDRGQWLKYDDA